MKRIIVACDGTGQSSSHGDYKIPTNVARFCDALSNSSSTEPQQIVFYQSGVGSHDLSLGVETIFQGATGDGFEDNLADAYAFTMNNYQPGDQLFIFGFSRGAFTARVLANIIARLGVISKKASWALRDTLKAYKSGPQAFEAHNKQMKEKDANWVYKVDIEVVGCWDTVASLGIPLNSITNPGGVYGEYKHYDGSLLKGIKRAFHALALDECRGPFTPTLWHLPEENGTADASIVLEQCWFPGAHSNVGGGYPDRALSNLTLAWMIDRCHPLLDFDREYLEMTAKLDREPALWHTDRPDRKEKSKLKFDKEYQGYGCGMLYDSYKLGQTYTWKYRTPGAYRGGVTNETIHPSVGERRAKKSDWKPEALKGLERKSDGVWKSAKDSKSIPESQFRPSESFEGLLRDGLPIGVLAPVCYSSGFSYTMAAEKFEIKSEAIAYMVAEEEEVKSEEG